MKTHLLIAARACCISVTAIFCAILVTGCGALPQPPARPQLYDLGPGPATAAAAPATALPALALADMDAPGGAGSGTAVVYRLAYADAQQLRPYSLARWSQPPAQLVQQRLREQLGQRRAILKAEVAAAQARDAAQGGRLPTLLRVELEEFSHIFSSATESAGVVRLRATLFDVTRAGELLRGHQVFTVRAPARSADAAGGVAALADASNQAAQQVAQWVEQLGR